MNPEDNWVILALNGSVHVENLTFILRLGIRQVTVDLEFSGEDRGGEEEEESCDVFHGEVPLPQVEHGTVESSPAVASPRRHGRVQPRPAPHYFFARLAV
jgi:hypothetical protein